MRPPLWELVGRTRICTQKKEGAVLVNQMVANRASRSIPAPNSRQTQRQRQRKRKRTKCVSRANASEWCNHFQMLTRDRLGRRQRGGQLRDVCFSHLGGTEHVLLARSGNGPQSCGQSDCPASTILVVCVVSGSGFHPLAKTLALVLSRHAQRAAGLRSGGCAARGQAKLLVGEPAAPVFVFR